MNIQHTSNSISQVIIVGGGMSAWLSAAYLRKALPKEIQIQVIEAPSIPRIGVGEATIPNLQPIVFDHLGIPEDDWMRSCKASFKMGIKFVNWQPRLNGHDNHYYHLFGIMPNCDGIPLSQYWVYAMRQERCNQPLAYACYREPTFAEANKCPRKWSGEAISPYAWHFDANLLIDFLRDHAKSRGVEHVEARVEAVSLDSRQFIKSVKTEAGQHIDGDLFIDCTGLRGLLINQALEEPFIDMSSMLLCDRAVATQLPGNNEGTIEPYTTATALNTGWMWKIPLLERYGTGYVHSSHFISSDKAILEAAAHWGVNPDDYNWRVIPFRVGRNQRAWVNNCVSIGLAANFLEPLESTALYLTYSAIHQLVNFFPDRSFEPKLREAYNKEVAFAYDDCRDFVQAHYCTTQREDTPFWRANRYELKVSDSIRTKVEEFKECLPINHIQTKAEDYYNDFALEFRNFWTNGSYYSVLSGNGLTPLKDYDPVIEQRESRERAQQLFEKIIEETCELLKILPDNRDYLLRLHNMIDREI